ncbi:GGDEF domain-containing response regulator [Limisalsivibrio acetivorans]|uniref:GGDEF domain-containing response regulator n=1 Tax=Limisalsivibrio acetivorans TaxID=1304888 RepID=UPI0003B6DFF4|nr:diguanylate cyclase [Limisalsivibrio acetivorans]
MEKTVAQGDMPEALKSVSILCVEDEVETRERLAGFLGKNFGEILNASDGTEGLEIYEEKRPDIVITDIQMPMMNGLEMAEEIRKVDPDVPIIITTGFDDEKYLVGSIDIGAQKYIKKPVDIKHLRGLLSEIGLTVLQRKEAERKRKLLRLVMQNSNELYIVTDLDNIDFINDTFLQYLGYESYEDFVRSGLDMNQIRILKDQNDYKGNDFCTWVREAVISGNRESVISIEGARSLKSEAKSFLAKIIPIPEQNCYLVSLVDITVLEKKLRNKEELSLIDPLTGVMNRKRFHEEMDRELQRVQRYSRPLSLILFDIDGFNDINERYGKQVGDYVIKEIAAVVGKNIRVVDVFARYGGEEFAVLAPETDMEGACILAEKIRFRIEQHDFEYAGRVTCSFGVTEYVLLESADLLIKTADDALYMAKSRGRNRVEKQSFI